jgi:hypothetical protein
VRRNRRWGYTIIGVPVQGWRRSPLGPGDGAEVSMTLTHRGRRIGSGPLPYNSSGQYFAWRVRHDLVNPGERVRVAAQATIDGRFAGERMATVVV